MTAFETVLAAHLERYPHMAPADCAKLAYQHRFGPAHLITDEGAALRALGEEWVQVPSGAPHRAPEDIGNGLCRFYLNDIEEKELGVHILIKLFCLTAKEFSEREENLAAELAALEKLPLPGMAEYLSDYRSRGCPPVRHSEGYRAAYDPRYRLLKWEYARLFPALLELGKLVRRGKTTAAIDGRCGSGKSTLARLAQEVFGCGVVHMDDFYLPPARRAENWLEIPGGNMDLDRLRAEVLEPMGERDTISYRPFDCGRGAYGPPVTVDTSGLTLIEGSYSHHPDLEGKYDLRLFVTCSEEEQLCRLKKREGDYFPVFVQVWKPLEERYIRRFDLEHRGAFLVDTGSAI